MPPINGYLLKEWEVRGVVLCHFNRPLLNDLVRTDLVYEWHCTATNRLHIIHFFECNEETLNWLKQKRNIFDFDYSSYDLDDLAFFKREECVFSTCTRERICSLDSSLLEK